MKVFSALEAFLGWYAAILGWHAAILRWTAGLVVGISVVELIFLQFGISVLDLMFREPTAPTAHTRAWILLGFGLFFLAVGFYTEPKRVALSKLRQRLSRHWFRSIPNAWDGEDFCQG